MKAQFHIFKERNFVKYVSGRFLFIASLYMQATVVAWEVYKLTNDPLSLGIIGLVEFMPAFFSTFYAGYIIDSKNKKNVLKFSIMGYFFCSLLLLGIVSSHSQHIIDNNMTTFLIYVIIFLTGIFRSFSGPGFFTFLSEIVKKKDYVTASNWHSNTWQIASVIGPAIGGFLYAFINLEITLCFVGILLVISWLSIHTIKHQMIEKRKVAENFLKNIFIGLAYIFRKKLILQILLLDLFAVLFGSATALLPIFVKDILHSDAVGLGILRSATSVGSILMISYMTLFPMKIYQIKKMILSVMAFGVCMIGFALSEYFLLSVFFLFLSGVFDSVSVIVRSNVLQLMVPQKFKGRVSSANTLFVMSSNELGALESGVTAKYLGAVNSVLLGGTMTILIGLQAWFGGKKLKKITY